VLDFSLSTDDEALFYLFESSTGAQDLLAQGSFLLDATGSINTFGFYDLRLQLSNRQDLTLEGRFQDGVDREYDFDIGPVDVKGNIFADLLAVLLDPIFSALGAENFFASFSTGLQPDELMQLLSADTQAKLIDWEEPMSNDVAEVFGVGALRFPDDAVAERSYLDDPLAGGLSGLIAVPEPGVLVLMLGPAAFWLLRKKRR
jgi:hypothetical protein